MDSKEKKIMRFTAASHGLVHLYEGVLPPLIPLLIGQFSTDYFHLGIVVSIFSYAFGFGALPAGFLADRLGPRRLVTLYLFGAGAFCSGILMVGSLWMYAGFMGFIGLFCSIYHPASNALISHSFREMGKAFGIHGIAGSFGIASVPILSAWIGSTMGWRTPHVLFGLLGLALAVYSFSIPSDRPAPPPPATGSSERGGNRVSYPTLIVFFLSATSLGLTYKGIATFLPAYLGQNMDLAFLKLDVVALGGTMATIALASGAAGQYVAGLLADRHKPENLYLVSLLVGTVFVFLMAWGSDLLLILSAVFYAFFYFFTQPIQNYLITQYLPKHRMGMGFGIHFFLTFGVGSTAAAVSGYLADRFGLSSVFYVMGAIYAGSAFLAGILAWKAKKR